jgi:hypothetical protein
VWSCRGVVCGRTRCEDEVPGDRRNDEGGLKDERKMGNQTNVSERLEGKIAVDVNLDRTVCNHGKPSNSEFKPTPIKDLNHRTLTLLYTAYVPSFYLSPTG